MVRQHLGEELNQALDGIAPTVFRGFSSMIKQQAGVWLPPSIWLTMCLLLACCALFFLLRLARGPDLRP